jgi:hypothetical protein
MNRVKLIVIIFTVFSACDDYKNETYMIIEMDDNACNILNADSLAVNKIAASMNDTVFASTQDSINFLIANDAHVLAVSSSPFYVTIFFLDDPITISMIDQTGHRFGPSDENIDLSTVAGCPEIKTRNLFDLFSGDYLIEVTGENLNSTVFVVMKNE